jgi:hypothetical protein
MADMSAASQQLVIAIDERLAEARQQIAALEAALAQVTSEPTPTARPAGSTRTSARTGPRRSRAVHRQSTPTVAVSAAQLERLLADADADAPLTTAALAELAGGRGTQVRAMLRDLETAGRVRRTGSGRGTRWRAITDEDRIAERAAQLAKQSRQAQAAQPEKAVTRALPHAGRRP